MVLALSPPAVNNMSRPTPPPASMKHRNPVGRFSPALLRVPLRPRRRCSAKVPVTISHSYVSLGWWMVMSEDEQGYAPAAYLEPVEGGGGKRVTEQVMEENSGTSEGEKTTLWYNY